MPAADASQRSLLIVGALPDIVEDQFARLFDSLGIGPIAFLPGRMSAALPAVGRGTRYLLAQPYLGETARALDKRGATGLAAPFPLGAEGTRDWLMAAAAAWDIPQARVDEVIAAPIARARRAVDAHRPALQDKRIAFLPDSQLELPLARFLASECGARLEEVGTPYLDRRLAGPELALLPDGVRITEGQDLDPQLDRIRASRPDLTVCGLGIANPLEAEGLRTKWSIELTFTPIQGFDQAGDLAGLFTRPLNRQQRLGF
jgi:light-independent protochlorophyllide reductase subunit N